MQPPHFSCPHSMNASSLWWLESSEGDFFIWCSHGPHFQWLYKSPVPLILWAIHWQVDCISHSGCNSIWAQEVTWRWWSRPTQEQDSLLVLLQVYLTHRTRRSGCPGILWRCSQHQGNGLWWSPWCLRILALEWGWVTARKGSLERSREMLTA
jgi:hypothetical protein